MNLNLFRVLSPAEQEAQRQYADVQEWCSACVALGATFVELTNYEAAAQAYARTTLYPNSAIVAAARQAAYQALQRGEGMPGTGDVAAAIQHMRDREMAAWLDRL